MSSIYVLIPLGLVLTGAAVWAFFWATENGQFDDLETRGKEIFDDEE